jgi:hypothetical protein
MVDNIVLAFPIVPGKSDQDATSISDMFASRPDEYRESRANAEVELERAYLQKTPMGNFVVAYIEANRPALETLAVPATSNLALDKDFVRMVKEVHGVDLSVPPPGPAPETLASWSDPQVTERRAGFAFSAPLLPGRQEAGRAFAKAAWGTRLDELTESRRALGFTREVVTLQPTPHGDVICVYLEGKDPAAGNRGFAASNTPYDRWFKDQLATLFIPQVDLSKPVTGITEIFDSAALLVQR